MRDGNACQGGPVPGGQPGIGRLRLGQRRVPGHGDKGVEVIVQARDTLQKVLRELLGRNFPLLERLGQLRNGCFVHACEVDHPGFVSTGGLIIQTATL